MPIIQATTSIDVPVKKAFAFAADYRNATTLVQGLTRFEPLGKKTKGKGAEFTAVIEIATKRYEAVLAVSVFEPDRAIGWAPASGAGHSLVWRFEPQGDRTAVEFELGHEPPGGVAGAMLSFTLEPMLRSRARATAAALKRELERA